MEKSIKMVRRVGGVMGELGRGLSIAGKSADILSIGPLFQELDRRWLEADTKRVTFCRFVTTPTALH